MPTITTAISNITTNPAISGIQTTIRDFSSNFLYTHAGYGDIKKVNIDSGTNTTIAFGNNTTVQNYTQCMIIYNNVLYCFNISNGSTSDYVATVQMPFVANPTFVSKGITVTARSVAMSGGSNGACLVTSGGSPVIYISTIITATNIMSIDKYDITTNTYTSLWCNLGAKATYGNSTFYMLTEDNGFLYGATNLNNPIVKIKISDQTYSTLLAGGAISGGGDRRIYGLLAKQGYLYVSVLTNQIYKIDVNDSTQREVYYDATSNPALSLGWGLFDYSNNLLIVNNWGGSLVTVPFPYIKTIPLNSVTFDTGNTQPVAVGNLKVSIIDTSNIALNAVYYWYSTNGTTYINSNIANNGPTQTKYTFFISGLTSEVNNVYVIAKNTVGNSTPVSMPVFVYSAPSQPNSYSTSFFLDTGINVSITDTNNKAANNIYYYYYYFRVGDTAPNQSGNIAVYSNSYVPLTSASSTTTFYIPNLMKGDYNIYVAAVNSYGANIYTPAMPPVTVICFKEDSRILTIHGYKKIQHLKKGDLVKTLSHGFKPIYRIGKKEITHTPTLERSKHHLYKCSPSQYPELFEDLVLTGCHSILVDDYVSEEQLAKSIEVNGRVYITEGKYRLPVCTDTRSSIYEKAGKYMVYHIALENDDYYMNYGIYANGLLVESTSKRFLDQFPIMET